MSAVDHSSPRLRCGRFELVLTRPLLMGIVNVTPDSFFEASRFPGPDAAIAHARRLIDDGADLLDIGGESTRPGAAPVDASTEIARIGPVLEALRHAGVPLSVDTRQPAVMRAALALGADMINDVGGFLAPGAIAAVAGSDAGLCVMHMLGEPATMQQAPVYRDVVADVAGFLDQRLRALIAAGVSADRVVLDPGIGFGKTPEDNLRLLRRLTATSVTGRPLLVGLSRKSFLGKLTGRPVGERLGASLGGALAAAAAGAAILRVHDVAQTRDALTVFLAIGGQHDA